MATWGPGLGSIARPLAALLVAALSVLAAGPAFAQPWARFAVPDSVIAGALRASGAQFENAWNALLIAELRASLARADSAARLLSLARRIAAAEPQALKTRIAADALGLRERWTPAQRRQRVAAGVAESLGTAAQGARDFGRADSLFGAALRAYERLGERRRPAWVWGSLGGVAFLTGDMVAADSLYRQALAARRAVGDLRLAGNALNTLGSIALNLRRHDDAWRFLREARAAREQIGDRAGLGVTLGALGNLASAMGQADSARAYYEAALALTVAQGDSARTFEVLNNYAVLHTNGSDPAAAMPYYERALVIARERKNVNEQAVVLKNQGNVLRQQGHFAEALPRLREARDLALAGRNAGVLREALLILGRVAIGLGDPSAARPPLERALALADSLRDPRAQAEALVNLAIAARLDGDSRGAERLAERALAAAAAASDSLLAHDATTTLGELAFDRGELENAERWFTRAAAAGALEESQRAGDLQNLGAVAARRERLDEAERHFRGALELSERTQSPDFAWPALLGLGDVAERRGDDAAALAFDRRAAAMIEALRAQQGSERPSVRLLARRLFAFEALIHLLGRAQARHPDSAYAEEAFHWSERARARAFLDLVAASGGKAEGARPLRLREAQQQLRSDDDALLVYSLGDSSSSLWVVTQRDWRHVPLPPRRALRTRVEILRRGLADVATADAQGTRAAARALYVTLIEPALPLLEGVKHLILAPDGVLALVPFETLMTREAAGGDGPPPRGTWLVERYAISYTPSASALAARGPASTGGANPGGGIVAVGDPTFAPAGDAVAAAAVTPTLAALPHTAAEIAALRSLAGNRPITVLSGRDATRERLLGLAELPGASILHIATHGEANEVEPERSGIWLAAAPGASAPGFLSVSDILELRLGAELVALSACETGLGRLEGGEGVIGLTRAFLAAGAQSVMVSLWKVNDRSTALLMERFYRGLLTSGRSGPIALARAKVALLERAETRSPFYWAPFVLVGRTGS